PPVDGRGLRGGRCRERTFDGRDDAFQIAQDVVVPEANDAPALHFKVAGAGPVVSCVFGMLAAVHFDDQPF
ncbi:hypothetical protein NS258_07410, partial [Sphingomonas sanguinis]